MSETVKIDDVVVRTIEPTRIEDFIDRFKDPDAVGLVLWIREEMTVGGPTARIPAGVREAVLLVGDINQSTGTCGCCGEGCDVMVYAWARVDICRLKEVKP
jgi:hypothetical protein